MPAAETNGAPAAANGGTGDAAPKKSGKKTLIMVAVMLIVEAAVILGVMKFLGGGPKHVSAVQMAHAEENSPGDKIVETLVLDAKMPNNKSGVSYIYAAEIYVQVRERHLEKVKGEIEQFQNEIKADITAIWRSAEPQVFQEPKLENLTRKVTALLNERFGEDKERNEPIVHKVVIVMSTGFRIDS
jgi:flagellar basal body-associated protein FliL